MKNYFLHILNLLNLTIVSFLGALVLIVCSPYIALLKTNGERERVIKVVLCKLIQPLTTPGVRGLLFGGY